MSNLSDGKKSFPWLQAGIVVLILVVVSGIYFYKNSAAADQANTLSQTNAITQSDKGLEQKPAATDTSTEEQSSEQNSQEAKDALPKLVDLGSTTCIPCQEMAPILAELQNEYKGKVDVEVVDVYEDADKTMEYNEKHPIRVIPTQILFDTSGNEVWSHEGSLSKEDLIQVFKEKVGVI